MSVPVNMRPRPLLLALILSVVACKKPAVTAEPGPDAGTSPSTSPSTSTSTSGVDTAAKSVVEAWSAALAKHDADALTGLYAANVDYYGTAMTRDKVVAAKRAALKAAPTFTQSTSNIVVEHDDKGATVARFTKRSGAANALSDVKAKLVLRDEGGKLRIVTETDEATEAKGAAAGDCLVVDEKDLGGGPATLEGTLSEGEHSHPNGSMFKFLYLTLPKERCVKGSSDEKATKEVQLAPKTENEKAAKALVGKKVKVTGTAFPQHTAWHVRPILIDVASISAM